MNKLARTLTLPILSLSFVACGPAEEPGIGESRSALTSQQLEALKTQVINLAAANTSRHDNIADVRAQLGPLIAQLAQHFADNRPADETTLVQGAWKSLWYDDPNIDSGQPGFLELKRDAIYQVVEDGYYYNVSESKFAGIFTVHSFLKGNYAIVDPAGPGTLGQQRRNVIDLEFADTRVKVGKISRKRTLVEQVKRIEQGKGLSFKVPGPKGITGQLWNLYLDDDLRISAGNQDDNPGVMDLYVLVRTVFAN